MVGVSDFPRGNPFDTDKQQAAFARWLPPSRIAELSKFRHAHGKLILGAVNGELIGHMDDRHMLTIAGSRTGKSVGVIANLLDYPGSVIVIDPKGELARRTASYRREVLKQKVYVLDPFGTTGAPTDSFNPLDAIDPESEDAADDAGLIADSLIIAERQGEDHWTLSARNLLRGLCLHVADTAPKELRNLLHVRDILAGDQRDLLDTLEVMADSDAFGGTVSQVGHSTKGKPENERGSVISTAIEQTNFLMSPAMERTLETSTFRLEDIKRQASTVYLCLPAGRMATHHRWLRIIINMATIAMERERTNPPLPVLFILDEFPVLGHMRSIEAAAGQIASFGVKLWPIIQDLSQLKAHYRASWETFVGNAGVTQWFGNSDHTTLEYLSKALGKIAIHVENRSELSGGQIEQGRNGHSYSTLLHELMTPDEIGRFFARETGLQLIRIPGYQPIAIERVRYYEHPYFEGRWDND